MTPMRTRIRTRAWAAAAATAVLTTVVPTSVASAQSADAIDRTSRAAVAEAYNTRLRPTHDVQPGWTGSTSSCTVGTESAASKQATLQAFNYYRAMTGLQPVRLDDDLNRRSLAAALMMHANGRLSHNPTASWSCHTADGAEAAGRANLGLNVPTGGATVSGYMEDPNVPSVGHRLWMLHPGITTIGTGSTGRANAMWIVPSGRAPNPAGTPEWMTWPTSGWFPWEDTPVTRVPRWTGQAMELSLWSAGSYAHPNADYSAATVTATANDEALDVRIVNRSASVGTGRSIVFNATRPGGDAFDTSADTRVAVTVSGARDRGEALEPLRYTVNLFAATEGARPAPQPAPRPTPSTPTTTPAAQPTPTTTPAARPTPTTTAAPAPRPPSAGQPPVARPEPSPEAPSRFAELFRRLLSWWTTVNAQ